MKNNRGGEETPPAEKVYIPMSIFQIFPNFSKTFDIDSCPYIRTGGPACQPGGETATQTDSLFLSEQHLFDWEGVTLLPRSSPSNAVSREGTRSACATTVYSKD